MLTIEHRLDLLERRNRRLTAALALMVVAICAVVTMAATGEKRGDFNIVTAKRGDFNVVLAKTIWVENDDEKFIVALTATDAGTGLVKTYGANGKELVELSATTEDQGMVTTFGPNGKEVVALSSTMEGEGMISTFGPNGKELVALGATENGGFLEVSNKTGEGIATMCADEYGNGVVGAYNRKGIGRTLEPGP